MAYNHKPKAPLLNNGKFGDKIEKVAIKPAKKIEVKHKEPKLQIPPSKEKKKKEGIDWGRVGAAAFLGTLGIATAATTIGGGHDSRKKIK
tara:strand:+ start:109 stop:378 length:270 start_codon:yes stop_codon:yes gene_type:complete